MSTVPTQQATRAADLIALALAHRLQASRAASATEQLELERVADIYTALATIDLPLSTFARIEGLASVGDLPEAPPTAPRVEKVTKF